jgi:hypothetical protein
MAKYRVEWTEHNTDTGKTVARFEHVKGMHSEAEAVWQVANDHVEYPMEAKVTKVTKVDDGTDLEVVYTVTLTVPNLPNSVEEVRQIIEEALHMNVSHDVTVKADKF